MTWHLFAYVPEWHWAVHVCVCKRDVIAWTFHFFLIFTFNIPIKSIHRSSECVNVFNYISLHMFVCVYWSLVHCAQRLPTRQKERTEIRANERSTREILVESGSTFYTYYYVFDSLCYAYIHHTHSHMTPHSCSSMCLWSLLGALWFSKF